MYQEDLSPCVHIPRICNVKQEACKSLNPFFFNCFEILMHIIFDIHLTKVGFFSSLQRNSEFLQFQRGFNKGFELAPANIKLEHPGFWTYARPASRPVDQHHGKCIRKCQKETIGKSSNYHQAFHTIKNLKKPIFIIDDLRNKSPTGFPR